jgi:hypothetical protein
MLFAEWMDKKGIKPADVEEEVKKHGLETTADMIYKVRNGKRRFSPEINRVIVEWSKGKVSWLELNFPEEFQDAINQ